jgi:hypothetical protein
MEGQSATCRPGHDHLKLSMGTGGCQLVNNLELVNCLHTKVSYPDAERLPREGKTAFQPLGSPWFYPRAHIRAKITHQRVVAILPCHDWLGMKQGGSGDYLGKCEVLGGSNHKALSLRQQKSFSSSC